MPTIGLSHKECITPELMAKLKATAREAEEIFGDGMPIVVGTVQELTHAVLASLTWEDAKKRGVKPESEIGMNDTRPDELCRAILEGLIVYAESGAWKS